MGLVAFLKSLFRREKGRNRKAGRSTANQEKGKFPSISPPSYTIVEPLPLAPAPAQHSPSNPELPPTSKVRITAGIARVVAVAPAGSQTAVARACARSTKKVVGSQVKCMTNESSMLGMPGTTQYWAATANFEAEYLGALEDIKAASKIEGDGRFHNAARAYLGMLIDMVRDIDSLADATAFARNAGKIADSFSTSLITKNPWRKCPFGCICWRHRDVTGTAAVNVANLMTTPVAR